VTKGEEAAVYAAPSGVTDGTFLPSGDKIALLTYSSVVVIDTSTYEVLASSPFPISRRRDR